MHSSVNYFTFWKMTDPNGCTLTHKYKISIAVMNNENEFAEKQK